MGVSNDSAEKWTFTYKTLIFFLIPVFVFSVFTFLYRYLANDCDFDKVWQTSTWFVYRLDTYRPLFTGLWFLETLFAGRLLLGDGGILFVRRNYKMISIVFFVLSCIIDFTDIEMSWYVSRIIQCFPFLGIGIYFKEHTEIKERMKDSKPVVVLFCAIAFVLLVQVNMDCDIMYNRYYRTYPLFFFNAVLGTLLLMFFCTKFRRSRIIENLSTGTLAILGTHIVVMDISCHYIKNVSFSSIVSPILSLLFAYIIIVFSLYYCPYILGKISSIKIKNSNKQ